MTVNHAFKVKDFESSYIYEHMHFSTLELPDSISVNIFTAELARSQIASRNFDDYFYLLSHLNYKNF